MATGLGYRACFSVLANPSTDGLEISKDTKKNCRKNTIFCMLCESSKWEVLAAVWSDSFFLLW